MYLGIDVGASKTLVAVFDKNGKVVRVQKIKTAHKYNDFINDLAGVLGHEEFKKPYSDCCCAVPGKIDRNKGLGITFGNLDWHNVAIKSELEKLLPGTKIWLENDANLAGIYEAVEYKSSYKKVLYLTLSTGVNGSILADGKLDPVLIDGEIGHMVLLHDGKLEKWEEFASGKALVKKYGLQASQITDDKIWREYAAAVAPGVDALLAIAQPEAVIIGGGVGAHLEKFQGHLEDELKKYQNNMVKIPPIIKAKKAEEAVLYGCYEYIRQKSA